MRGKIDTKATRNGAPHPERALYSPPGHCFAESELLASTNSFGFLAEKSVGAFGFLVGAFCPATSGLVIDMESEFVLKCLSGPTSCPYFSGVRIRGHVDADLLWQREK